MASYAEMSNEQLMAKMTDGSTSSEELENIIETQRRVVEYMKSKKKLYQILILVDDFADDPAVMRRSGFVTAFLLFQGAHQAKTWCLHARYACSATSNTACKTTNHLKRDRDKNNFPELSYKKTRLFGFKESHSLSTL